MAAQGAHVPARIMAATELGRFAVECYARHLFTVYGDGIVPALKS